MTSAELVLALSDVTLCCIDAKNHALAVRALARSREHIEFRRTLFLTHAVPADVRIPSDVEVIEVGPIGSHEDYSRIVLKGVYPHIRTTHVLIVQWDGYVVHPEMWTDAFLECDYLGAPWPDGRGGYTVGNGGFSLRSRKLLQALQDPSFSLITNTEDVTICGHHRSRLEAKFGIEFGPPALAKVFSFEMDQRAALAGTKTFGFHGLFNLFLVERESELIGLAQEFPKSLLTSDMMVLLLKNLMHFGQFEAAYVLGRRMLRVNPDSIDAAEAVVAARAQVELRRLSSGLSRKVGFSMHFIEAIRRFRNHRA